MTVFPLGHLEHYCNPSPVLPATVRCRPPYKPVRKHRRAKLMPISLSNIHNIAVLSMNIFFIGSNNFYGFHREKMLLCV